MTGSAAARPVKRWFRHCRMVLVLGACASCITFPDNPNRIDPTLQVFSVATGHVGDTLNFFAQVRDANGNDLYTREVPLVAWSFPRTLLDSVDITPDGKHARFRARNPGTFTLLAYTYPTANMPAESVSVSTYVRYPWSALSAGRAHTCARSYFDEVFCWGDASSGAGGVVRPEPVVAPARVTVSPAAPRGFSRVSAGGAHSCATLWAPPSYSDTAYCWGANASGQLGDGSGSPGLNPLPVTVMDLGGTPLRTYRISSGARHTCAVAARAYCWGAGEAGQLGSTESLDACGEARGGCSFTAREVAGLATVEEISAGGNSTCALAHFGEASCWGDNTFGQAGVGDTSRVVPLARRVDTTVLFQQLDVGSSHSCGVTRANIAYCWGSNRYGQLGVRVAPDTCGEVPCSRRPMAVAGGSIAFTHIQAGEHFTCAISVDRGVYCWGLNDVGQTGGPYREACGDSQCTPLPEQMWWGTATALAAGDAHACLIDTVRDLYCWGRNTNGQLGDGSVISDPNPRRVVDPVNP